MSSTSITRFLPDLLHAEPRSTTDGDRLFANLELSFLGRDTRDSVERALGAAPSANGWRPGLFATDLFIDDLIRKVFSVEIDGQPYGLNRHFLFRVLTRPPTDPATLEFRQEILRELTEDADVRRKVERLYAALSNLLEDFKIPDHVARLDINSHRLEIFQQIRWVVEWMAEELGGARSGLRRIQASGEAIRKTEEYRRMASLLDYEGRFMGLNVDLALGPDGRVRRLDIRSIAENTANPFYRGPWNRWLDRLKLLVWHGTYPSNREMVNNLLHQVFLEVSTPLLAIVELAGHLELYLASLGFRRAALQRGLEVSLARFSMERPLRVERAFNPHLLDQTVPVPADVERGQVEGTTLLTGPNSGGKTRLLQTLGLVQLLGQSGLYVPAASAELPIVHGLFVSLIESEAADQDEGRLGREMVRIRSLFEGLGSPSMVILDELCSGTNPSEGTELFSLVLRLLEQLGTVAFISTHFLDYAQQLAAEGPHAGLEFLQVEIDADQRSTYQFLPGVARSSLAAVTAERLGVTYEQLASLIERHRDR